MNFAQKLKYKISKKLKEKIRKWLDVPSGESRYEMVAEFRRVRKEIKNLVDGSIVGVDLGYREDTEIVIIKYSRINNAFKIIADSKSRMPSYNIFIRHLRKLCTDMNAKHLVLDCADGVNAEAIKVRVLPDEKIMDQYRELMDG